MTIAGCVPAYNNESTIKATIESLKAQTIPFEDIFVVDDGSTDSTAEAAMKAGARVVSMGSNQGRGAARARAIEETQADLLLSVDGTNALAPDFLAKSLPWFEDDSVAAVYGRITQTSPKTSVDRWRGRHLYQQDAKLNPGPTDHLITWGFTQRTSHIKRAGNFHPECRHSEDAELGQRLIDQSFKIIYEPNAVLTTLTSNTLRQVFERYWRWNQGRNSRFRLIDSAKFGWYALKVMAGNDLRAKDLTSAGISTLLPIYCTWRALQKR